MLLLGPLYLYSIPSLAGIIVFAQYRRKERFNVMAAILVFWWLRGCTENVKMTFNKSH
jgi:ABC-type dipeptide/oligopeptide/nickel transport system permease subunit